MLGRRFFFRLEAKASPVRWQGDKISIVYVILVEKVKKKKIARGHVIQV